MFRRLVAPLALSLLAVGSMAAAVSAGAAPAPITVPGGLQPGAAADSGDCAVTGVQCRPDLPGSCTGFSSQTTPPTSIKVLIRTGASTVSIKAVDFRTYVEDVLPNEWVPTWDGEAIRAGAIAVKSYAWYWTLHFGGYLNTTANCFDVTDDTDFQKYVPGSGALPDSARTTKVIGQTWPFAARKNGQILQTFYQAQLNPDPNGTDTCGAFADGTTMSQTGTQACNEASTANKYNLILAKYYSGLQLATAQQRRTPYDFTFLQKSTPVAFHAGHWTLGDGYPTTFSFGTSGDLPTVLDAGDGFARVGVFRPSTGRWYEGNATGGLAGPAIPFGTSGDVPVPAHYSGVSKPSVIGVFRPANGNWYRPGLATVQFGQKGDIAVPGHYAGTTVNDFADRPAVFRPSTGRWYRQGLPTIAFGRKGDIPLPADYDKNGTTDIAVYRPSTHTFYVRGGVTATYGTTGDVPVSGDFNADGYADLAVYRPSAHTWFIRGQASVVLGATGDTPIGKAPYRG